MANKLGFLMQTDTVLKLPVYMTGAGHWDHQDPIHRPGGYPQFQWLHCVSGQGELAVRGQTYRVRPGSGMFLYPDEEHAYYGVEKPWEVYWMTFLGPEVEALARLAGMNESAVYPVHRQELILNHMKNALSLTFSDKPLAGLECSKLAYMFFIDLMTDMTMHAPSTDQGYLRLQPVFDHMEEHYARDLPLQELALQIGVSAQHLCLLFRKILNKRPMEYLNQLRIHKSKERLLEFPEARIGEIARQVGFTTPGYFSTLFKRTEGMTPEAFRKLNGVR
ncbi:AraC family transcriptional regulator [Paenibacillus sp. FSL W8-0194]|uniref:helix-turn-helix transcriptional regulator n=1 Tax=Paenibacillus sp. FSL W8-0194 TaxID=2921711 RepID=UPI0030DAE122